VPRPTYPRDRFDELSDENGRVGAHRAENPRMRGGVVFLWAAVATVVLVVAGIFGTLVATGRISLTPDAVPSETPVPVVEPVVDTTYEVLVINATPQSGLATQIADVIKANGWSSDLVNAGGASGSTDFETTTVYYPLAGDEAAARGLADVIGGAAVAMSDQYAVADDPATERDESRILTVVVGLDRVAGASATPAA
jgi:hypothetical protein